MKFIKVLEPRETQLKSADSIREKSRSFENVFFESLERKCKW